MTDTTEEIDPVVLLGGDDAARTVLGIETVAEAVRARDAVPHRPAWQLPGPPPRWTGGHRGPARATRRRPRTSAANVVV